MNGRRLSDRPFDIEYVAVDLLPHFDGYDVGYVAVDEDVPTSAVWTMFTESLLLVCYTG